MLNLSNIKSSIHIIAMFTIINLQTICHKQYVGMSVTYVHAQFHMPSSNCSTVIAVKLKAKDNFCTATMLLFPVP